VECAGIGVVRAAAPTEAYGYQRSVRQFERELAEDGGSAGFFDESEAVSGELMFWVEDNEIIGLKEAANVVDADGEKALRCRELGERWAAAADDEGLAKVQTAVFVKLPGSGRGLRRYQMGGPPSGMVYAGSG